MKTTQTLPVPALPYKLEVKKYLIKGIIYLTSEKLSIFAGVIAVLTAYIGIVLDNGRFTTWGAVIFLIGVAPWAIRMTARDFRRGIPGCCDGKQ